ncbi:MAG: hypothetical protein JRH11_20070, partial [Deltaproteobacteria bacterium]|nr:hypothetical protein [Deltaproteobacteria bacterium]
DAAAGEDGRDHADRPAGGARGRSCVDGSNYGGAGGDGGGSPLDGANGASNGRANSNGGGGGGGAGCILIRNATASLPAGLAATSPTASPGLRAAMITVE